MDFLAPFDSLGIGGMLIAVGAAMLAPWLIAVVLTRSVEAQRPDASRWLTRLPMLYLPIFVVAIMVFGRLSELCTLDAQRLTNWLAAFGLGGLALTHLFQLLVLDNVPGRVGAISFLNLSIVTLLSSVHFSGVFCD